MQINTFKRQNASALQEIWQKMPKNQTSQSLHHVKTRIDVLRKKLKRIYKCSSQILLINTL